MKAELAERLRQLTPEKRAALERKLLEQRTAGRERFNPIPRGEPGAAAPLAFPQERVWFLDQMLPGEPMYNHAEAVRLRGRLDREALAAAFQSVWERHDALRISISSTGSSPVQAARPVLPFHFKFHDLRGLEERTREETLARMIREIPRRRFNLRDDVLTHAELIQVSEEEHILITVLHHVVCDGWSMGILWRELSAFYNARLSGEDARLSPLTIQYPDFARWQRSSLHEAAMQADLAYWKRRLEGAGGILEIPADHPRPARLSYCGGHYFFRLEADSVRRLQALAAEEEASLFMALAAAFNALLFRYTGQTDILVGYPYANRERTEAEPLIGFFVNTQVLRTNLEGLMSFRELLRRVRETMLDDYPHRALPFEKLVEALQPGRSLNRMPLVQVMLNLRVKDTQMSALDLAGVSAERINIGTGTSRCDLTLMLIEDDGGLHAELEYSSELFELATVQRFAGHLIRMIESACANPEEAISRLEIMGEKEQKAIVSDWNRTETDYPRDESLGSLLLRRIKQTPDEMAVSEGEKKISYRELGDWSAEIGANLRRRGIQSGEIVGLYLERSSSLIAAIAGVIRAGGAYLPLDRSYPAERLKFMLGDSGVRIVLTVAALRAACEAELGIPSEKIICVDERAPELALPDETGRVRGDDLACVIYTSGSTGKPKGVEILHRGIARLVMNTNYIQFRPEDVVAHASNASFDAATLEIWGALLNGARLEIVPQETLLAPVRFAGFLRERRISVLFLTTALLNEIVRKVPDAFATLRVLMFGGEAVNPQRIAEILKHGAPQDLIHLYGPAENTTLGTWHRVRAVPEGALTIPIGKPVANSRVYLLDGDCRPVPIGVTGEIYVGGDGLARGYLRRPELTEQQFLEVALRRDLRERLYRTGDLGRYLADGSIEFQGRADNQIKLRGLRIELGEIEAALRDHAEVAQAIVDFQGSGQEDKKLVAYVVPRAGCAPSHSTLRNHLKPRLPAFMIPAQFGLIRELPLTPNGKVDRECLPTLTAGNAERDAYVPPRTAVERRLQEIWERVLNMRPIGREDGFFELGGHSLLAIKLMEEIEIAFGRRLPLTSIFTAGTYRRQAELLRKNARSRSNPHVAEIQSEGAKPAIYFPQSGRFAPLLLHDLACALGKDRPLIALQASWLDAEKPKFGRIEDMADFYIRVLKEVQPQGPYFLGGYCIGGLLAYEMARRLEAAGESAPLLVMIETFPENAVYSPIMTGIERVGRLLNWPEERMIKTFLRIREWGIFLRRVWSKLPRAASRGGFNQLRRRLAQSGWWRSQPVIEFANQPKLEMGRSEGTENVGERPQNLPQYPIDPSIRILFETERHLRFAYVPRPYYGRTMVFRAEEVKGGRFGTEALNQRGWRRVARGRLDDFEVPGDHFGILRQPSVEFIAKRIQSALEEIERQAASV